MSVGEPSIDQPAPQKMIALFMRAAPSAAVVFGAIILAVALVGDFLAISGPGVGANQIAIFTVGAALTITGAIAAVFTGQKSATETLRFGVITAQVALVVIAIRAYDIENIGFANYVAPLIFTGFIAHHYLPMKWRAPFFLALSVAGIIGVLHLKNTLIILGAGGLLVSLCHLKAPAALRIALILAVTTVFALFHIGAIKSAWSAAVIPIFSAMFMFRLSIYFYDVSNGKGPKNWSQRFAYFFMLPNATFPFFPVVDFTAWGRNYYNEDALRIYERGASWMLRGLVHLLLYRVVSYYLLIDPATVTGPASLLWYAITNFFLYLKISGLFHLIIGVLLLFGYNLPETHTRFYFSNSFIDFWRRINIYWKDYMQKMTFTPSFMALNRRGVGQHAAILISMLIVFFVTWALHAYQWFWIRGDVHFSGTDAFFWGFLAVMLVAQTHYEYLLAKRKHSGAEKQRILGHKSWLVLRTICTMLTIFFLWSLWSSASFGEWFELLHRAGLPAFANVSSPASLAILALWIASAAFLLLVAVGFTFGLAPHHSLAPRVLKKKPAEAPFYFAAGSRIALTAALLALQTPAFTAPFAAPIQQFALDIGTSKLNARDAAALERGYYEGLTDVNRFNTELWELYSKRPTGWVDIRETEAARDTGDYTQYELKPSTSIIYKGRPFQTNRWGMRDKHYPLEKPSGAYRIALIGDSRAMGYGIANPDTFESILEERLNREGGGYSLYEILNFGVADYKPIQRLMTLENKVLAFKPDAFIYTGHFDDFELRHLADAVKHRTPLPYPELAAIVEKSGATSGMSLAEIRKRVYPFEDEVMRFAMARLAMVAAREHITPIWIYLPSIKDYTPEERAKHDKLIAMARDAGFHVHDLLGIFDKEDKKSLWVAEWDTHPNRRGNEIIANRLFDIFNDDPELRALLKLSPPKAAPAISQ